MVGIVIIFSDGEDSEGGMVKEYIMVLFVVKDELAHPIRRRNTIESSLLFQ